MLRENFRKFVHDNFWRLLSIALVVGAAAGLAVLAYPPFVGGVLLGGLSVFFAAIVLLAFLVQTEGIQQLVGAWGEDNTSSELEHAQKLGYVWGWVNNVEVGLEDIDHVVVTPAGVFAIESKWHFREIKDGTMSYDVYGARRAADKAAKVLLTTTVRMPEPVRPVVSVWGRGHRELGDGGKDFEGVPVVSGYGLVDWLRSCQVGLLSQGYAEQMLERLARFKTEQHQARERLANRRNASSASTG
jgi:hypothetical protein